MSLKNDELAFKGGTALRKLFAGTEGRFSTDLDFSVRSAEGEMAAVVDLLVEAIVDSPGAGHSDTACPAGVESRM